VRHEAFGEILVLRGNTLAVIDEDHILSLYTTGFVGKYMVDFFFTPAINEQKNTQ
jgi:hypothetical protein